MGYAHRVTNPPSSLNSSISNFVGWLLRSSFRDVYSQVRVNFRFNVVEGRLQNVLIMDPSGRLDPVTLMGMEASVTGKPVPETYLTGDCVDQLSGSYMYIPTCSYSSEHSHL